MMNLNKQPRQYLAMIMLVFAPLCHSQNLYFNYSFYGDEKKPIGMGIAYAQRTISFPLLDHKETSNGISATIFFYEPNIYRGFGLHIGFNSNLYFKSKYHEISLGGPLHLQFKYPITRTAAIGIHSGLGLYFLLSTSGQSRFLFPVESGYHKESSAFVKSFEIEFFIENELCCLYALWTSSISNYSMYGYEMSRRGFSLGLRFSPFKSPYGKIWNKALKQEMFIN